MIRVRAIVGEWLKRFLAEGNEGITFNRRCLLYGILAMLLMFLVGLVLYTGGLLGPAKVVGVKVEIGTLKPTVFGIGTVQAKMNYNVGSTQSGKILKLFVDQGDAVKAGQVIGEIDPIDLDQRIASSNAALVSSQHDVAVARAQIQDARSRSQLAQATVSRYEKLFENGAISKELLETKQNDAEVARAALDAALSAFESAQSKVVQANANYQGQVEQKRNLLLVSPVDGIVASRQAEEGSTVVAGQAIYNIIDPKTLWVQTRVDQNRFSGVALGQTAEIVLRSNQSQKLFGKVVRLEIQGDTVTEERFVDVKFTDNPGTVLMGDLAEVTIKLPEVIDCLYIPAAAVKTSNGSSYVWVVQSSKPYYRAVKTGVQTMDGKIQIVSGLERTDTVIVYSKSQITEGVRVRLVSAL